MDDENNMNEDGELDNIIVLNDQDGNEVPFEYVDAIEYDGEEYAVLLPIEDEEDEENDDGDVVILRVEDSDSEDEEETYASVDDEQILQAVFEIFKEKFKDEFNFIEDENE